MEAADAGGGAGRGEVIEMTANARSEAAVAALARLIECKQNSMGLKNFRGSRNQAPPASAD